MSEGCYVKSPRFGEIFFYHRKERAMAMKSYSVKFQTETKGSTVQQTTVQAASRADARAKVLSRHSFHKIRIISVEER